MQQTTRAIQDGRDVRRSRKGEKAERRGSSQDKWGTSVHLRCMISASVNFNNTHPLARARCAVRSGETRFHAKDPIDHLLSRRVGVDLSTVTQLRSVHNLGESVLRLSLSLNSGAPHPHPPRSASAVWSGRLSEGATTRWAL